MIRYTHVKCKGPNSYQSKDTDNLKVFADKQTDGQTNGLAKNYMARTINAGHKNQ